jgi:mannose-1-phosphate guanylyltransferase/mannose-1-phosphate guanylyltransferase/mannose-6-phosphate isomerase
MARIHPVLLSGGAGSRLWPLSRETLPKQFLPLTSERTLLQEAALRFQDSDAFAPLRVIASAPHRFLVAQQLESIGMRASAIVLEPSGRNTTAAAATAALMVSAADAEGLLLLAPADHRIVDVEAFHEAVRIAAEAASGGFLSLFGITPDSPATGYGYIRVGERLPDSERARRVAAFVEKPDRPTAQEYVSGGYHLWNSGIFLLPVRVFLSELERYEPELLGHAREALELAARDSDFVRLDPQAFDRCRSISVDHAVMERTDRLAVVPVDCGWTDVGSWTTLAELCDRDFDGNTLVGEVLTVATRNSYVRGEGPLVATLGVEDLIVIATPDAVLVAHKDRDQDIKQIVDRLRAGNHGRF